MPATSAPPILHSESPIVLFARLELAVERGDHATAAAVQRALAALGIDVRYGRPIREGRKAVPDAPR
jgi:hypothetical protein